MPRPKVGDVVRAGDAGAPDVEWFVCVQDPRWQHPVLLCVVSGYEQMPRVGTRVGEAFSRSQNDTIVPPDGWPDEVCVAVAKWRLTNG